MEKSGERNQDITVRGRKSAEITGVKEVLSFDSESIALDTELGILNIEGSELCVTKLDTEGGVVAFGGRINGMFYSDGEEEKKGFFGRLFR